MYIIAVAGLCIYIYIYIYIFNIIIYNIIYTYNNSKSRNHAIMQA